MAQPHHNRYSFGSGIITVTANSHGSKAGGYVTLAGATAVDGITADEINQNFEILLSLQTVTLLL